MISRRSILFGGVALSAGAATKMWASSDRFFLSGSFEQGGLVVGHTAPSAMLDLDGKPIRVSPQGLFCFGLAFDVTGPLKLTASFPDGSQEIRAVTPHVRQYDVRTVNGLPPETVEPSPEVAERIAREHETIWKAREVVTDGSDFASPIEWPCPGRLSGIYGSRSVLNGKEMAPHLGVDVAAPEGTPIHAAADGVVAICDEYVVEGGFTLIDHGLGVNTCYLHQSQRLVTVGQKVKRGEVIGLIGHTGRATGPHTHWGLCWFQMKLDPSRATRTPTPPEA